MKNEQPAFVNIPSCAKATAWQRAWRRQINNNGAFSIIEVMVAIGIVSVGMMGVLSLMTLNILTQPVNKNNLIASMLAQEGLELVREVRDTNWLDPDATVGFADGIPATSTIDISGFKSSNPSVSGLNFVPGLDFNSTATDLKIDANGFYGHVGATSTLFKRLITVSSTSPEFITVRATVRWSQVGKTQDYVAETLLYDWR